MKMNPQQCARAYIESCNGKTEAEARSIADRFIEAIRRARVWEQMPLIIAHIAAYEDAHKGVVPITITTARRIAEPLQKRIAAHCGYPDARITESVDPKIIGGFVARSPDMLYDASLKTQLQQLIKHLQS